MNLTTHHLSSSNFRTLSNLDFHHYPLQKKSSMTLLSHTKMPSTNQDTNINSGKIFLNLIKKNFPPHCKFHKFFNKNTLKISSSCTRNIKTIINSHNAKILFPKKRTEQRTCNCLSKINCPLEKNSVTANIVYKAKVTSSN